MSDVLSFYRSFYRKMFSRNFLFIANSFNWFLLKNNRKNKFSYFSIFQSSENHTAWFSIWIFLFLNSVSQTNQSFRFPETTDQRKSINASNVKAPNSSSIQISRWIWHMGQGRHIFITYKLVRDGDMVTGVVEMIALRELTTA